MSCSFFWLKDDFRMSGNQALTALLNDKNLKKRQYIYMKKMHTIYARLRGGGLLNL